MANLTRYDPFSDLDNLFGGFALRPVRIGPDTETGAKIRIDVTENDTGYTVHADIPGARKEDISVSVNGNQVAISAELRRGTERNEGERLVHRERYHGSVYRAFTLDTAVDEDASQAAYRDGVLELRLRKKKVGGPNRIAIA